MTTQDDSASALERKLRQACQQLDARLRAGEMVRAESWLHEQPDLSQHEESAVELIFAEFLAREAIGQKASPEEYYERFPQWKNRLERLFNVDELLRDSLVEGVNASNAARRASSAGINSYEIMEHVGSGSMGKVYKAGRRSIASSH